MLQCCCDSLTLLTSRRQTGRQTLNPNPNPNPTITDEQEADKAAKNAALASLGISRLESFTVDHCANAFGLQLEAEDGWKIVFSGDTRPCMNVVQAAKNALILIHEVGLLVTGKKAAVGFKVLGVLVTGAQQKLPDLHAGPSVLGAGSWGRRLLETRNLHACLNR